jgi:HPt (histidine-containing phosphotransfer) domain-containing protein
MIIYDNNKQFIGIDEENLKSLGYSNLASLLAEAEDFANLFVKIPGHVHNFKNVHWIDFILCATDKDASKAVIQANSKSYSCTLDIKTIYLTTSPVEKSFNISLNNLRALSSIEVQNISGNLQSRPTPLGVEVIQDEFEEELEPTIPEIDKDIEIEDNSTEIDDASAQTNNEEEDHYENIEDEFNLDMNEPSEDEVEKTDDTDVKSIQIDEESIDENLDEHISIDDDLEEEPKEQVLPQNQENDEDKYLFDIKETADALEMDIATVEDFVNDFVVQAKEFKPKLYEAVENDDITELKSLSHQLKGVAANLRIQDAQNILIKINKSDDFTTSIVDLDEFYAIIAKLSVDTPEIDQIKEQDSLEDEATDEAFNITEIDEQSLEDDTLNIPEVTSDESIEDTPKEETFDIAEIDEDALEIDAYDSFDLLDEEQNDKKDISSEVEDIKLKQPYNKMDIANQIGLDEDDFNQLFEDYSNDSKALIKEAQEAIDSDDSKKWQYAAIKLKGMSDNMRIESFKSELEALINTQNSSDAKNTLNKIEKAVLTLVEKKE